MKIINPVGVIFTCGAALLLVTGGPLSQFFAVFYIAVVNLLLWLAVLDGAHRRSVPPAATVIVVFIKTVILVAALVHERHIFLPASVTMLWIFILVVYLENRKEKSYGH